jgi:hypothetical protein
MGGDRSMTKKIDNDEEQKIKYMILKKLDKAQALVNEIKELMKKINLVTSTEQ